MVQVAEGAFAGRMTEVARPATQQRIDVVEELGQGEGDSVVARKRLHSAFDGFEGLTAGEGVHHPFAVTRLPLDAKAEEIESLIDVRDQRLRG